MASSSSPNTVASATASAYEKMAGGCTARIAAEIVSMISPSINSSSYILDNACGPGIVTKEIKLHHPDAKIMAADLNPSMIEQIKAHVSDRRWTDVETAVQDIRSLSAFPDSTFTHVIANLGIQVLNDSEAPVKAVREMFRVLKPDGVIVVSTWADRVWPIAFTKTAKAVRPTETPKNGVALEPELLRGSWLFSQLEQGGFGTNAEVRSFVTYTSARDIDELTENMMMAKPLFFPNYSDDELQMSRNILKGELAAVRTFEVMDDMIRIGMKSWIGVGWKRGDEDKITM